MHADAVAIGGVTVRQHRGEAGYEISRTIGDRQRVPAQPVRVRRPEAAAQQSSIDAAIGRMIGGGTDAIQPAPARLPPGHRERGGSELLGIEAERWALRRISANWQRAGN